MPLTLDGVISAIRSLEACNDTGDFARRSVDFLWELVPCDGVSFNELDESTRHVDLFLERTVMPFDVSDEEFWSYADDLPICKGLPPGVPGVVRTEDVVSRRRLRSMAIYSEVLRPQGAEHEMKLAFASPTWISRGFIFARADRAFSDREYATVRLIAPHLSDVYRRLRVTRTLTMREREVLALVAQGSTNRQIAAALDIAPGTVRAHLEHIFQKLGVKTRTAAVAAIR